MIDQVHNLACLRVIWSTDGKDRVDKRVERQTDTNKSERFYTEKASTRELKLSKAY